MLLSVIIPVYNEEKTIKEIINRVKIVKLPSNILKEIIVVDDASSDKTRDILAKINNIAVFRNTLNLGKGASVAKGIDKSNGEIIIIQDADLEYNPEDFPKLISPILRKKSLVVYGTRLKNYPVRLTGKKKTPLLTHYIGNKLLSSLTRLIYKSQTTDMETGYKVFHKKVLKGITLKSKRFEFEAEITAKILRKGFKIYEIPIKVKPRGYEDGKKISWKDGFIALWTLLKYRFID